MASPYAKRLQKLEELLASRINQPLATIWVEDGETKEEAITKAGYDPSMADRIHTVRWMSPEEIAAAPPPPWEVPHAGPPTDDAGQIVRGDAPLSETGETPVARNPDAEDGAKHQLDLEELIAANEKYEAAIKRRESEIVSEKLQAATRAFSKSIA